MKKITTLALCLSLALILSGCIASFTPAGNNTDFDNVDLNSKLKKGEDCLSMFFVFGPFGNMDAITAAKSAKISKVKVVNYRIENYVFFQKRCIEVYGN